MKIPTDLKVFAVSLCLILFGCGMASFNYTVYGLNAKSYEGTLQAHNPKDDLPLSACAPEGKKSGKCVVVLANEYYRLKNDYLATKQALIDLQKKCPAN